MAADTTDVAKITDTAEENKNSWTMCLECRGRGRKNVGVSQKARRRYQKELRIFEKTNGEGTAPVHARAHVNVCVQCAGCGLLPSAHPPVADSEHYPRLAIIGGGIGGVALAVACLHRGIPFTLYERDRGFDVRSQGYGLTLQQASKAMKGLGIVSLTAGVTSTKHVVHTTDGTVIGEWGIRKWGAADAEKSAKKRRNVHIARQSLRLALLEQLGGSDMVQWGHQLVDFQERTDADSASGEQTGVDVTFHVAGASDIKIVHADLLVGADGIRSVVRKRLIGDEASPLRYLGCMVILGICPLKNLEQIDGLDSALLDSATVFQTANGNERMYMMPYDADSIMWQLSFPIAEAAAQELSAHGAQALKEEARRRTPWHDPIPQIVSATQVAQVTGYPAYDREPLDPELLKKSARVTLIGDAAHPMSPFKGQGANQALLDALALARGIARGCKPGSQWQAAGLRQRVLNECEAEMLERSAHKIRDSAAAAAFLHSEVALYEGNEPRGRCLRRARLEEEQEEKERLACLRRP